MLVVDFLALAAGPKGNRLLEAVGELVRELGAGADGGPEPLRLSAGWRVDEPFTGLLDAEDEELAAALTAALTELAERASTYREGRSPVAIAGALRGAEFVIRSELVAGSDERLGELFPSFVYVLTVPALGQSAALGLSRRMRELLG
jgi:hypothetical protein